MNTLGFAGLLAIMTYDMMVIRRNLGGIKSLSHLLSRLKNYNFKLFMKSQRFQPDSNRMKELLMNIQKNVQRHQILVVDEANLIEEKETVKAQRKVGSSRFKNRIKQDKELIERYRGGAFPIHHGRT